jgi:hypothetical protein
MRDLRGLFQRFVCIAACLAIVSSCSIFRRDKDEKYYEKQQKLVAKQEEKDYKKRQEYHKELQSKQTLKMMRQREREAKKLNKPKKR